MKLVVFTDLDGTLLDYHDYSFEAARPALESLNAREIPLVLCSSKTRHEMQLLRRAMQNAHPFICENGGAVYLPPAYFDQGVAGGEGDARFLFGAAHGEIVSTLRKLRREHDFDFAGFSDWDVQQVAAETGLTTEEAALAKQRDCSEPILWYQDDQARRYFKTHLHAYGLDLVQGGRFFHVMGGGFNKGTAVRWLTEKYRHLFQTQLVTAALGDAPNDVEMLQVVDCPMVIPSKRGESLTLQNQTGVYYAATSGPLGWLESINRLLRILF